MKYSFDLLDLRPSEVRWLEANVGQPDTRAALKKQLIETFYSVKPIADHLSVIDEAYCAGAMLRNVFKSFSEIDIDEIFRKNNSVSIAFKRGVFGAEINSNNLK